MASIGHPLVGDALYGGAPAAGLTRQALHAFRLGFGAIPVTRGGAERLLAEPPPDIVQGPGERGWTTIARDGPLGRAGLPDASSAPLPLRAGKAPFLNLHLELRALRGAFPGKREP